MQVSESLCGTQSKLTISRKHGDRRSASQPSAMPSDAQGFQHNKLDIDESPGARVQGVTSEPVVAGKPPPIWTGLCSDLVYEEESGNLLIRV
jgi:hypothetical protein